MDASAPLACARQTAVTQNRPVDATIMAIVDLVEVEGDRRYVKD